MSCVSRVFTLLVVQEPYNNTWIKHFVQQYDVTFPLFNKTIVNDGDDEPVDPVFQFVKSAFPGDLEWNFVSPAHTHTYIPNSTQIHSTVAVVDQQCDVMLTRCFSTMCVNCVSCVCLCVQVKFFVDHNGAPIRRFSTPVSEFKEIEKFIVEMLNQRDALYNGTMTPIIPPSPSSIASQQE